MKKSFIRLARRVCLASLALPALCLASIDDARVASAQRYEHGEGIPQDLPRAAELYCEAAREGSVEAQYRLGWMYFNGRGVPRDDTYAAGLLNMAAAKDHHYATIALKYVKTDVTALPACLTPPPQVVAEAADEPPPRPIEEEFGAEHPQRAKIIRIVQELSPKFGVDPRLALSVIRAESGFDVQARSPKNAQGLMQLIPETAERFNVKNPWDPRENIRGGLAYLRWLLAYFGGDIALAVAAYNAGEGAVDKHKGIPPYAETREYVKRVLGFYGKRKTAVPTPAPASPSSLLAAPMLSSSGMAPAAPPMP
jgi:soluble lytic murein transglycosylase-like protein